MSVLFHEFKFNGELVKDWQCWYISNDDMVRIYGKSDIDSGNGFEAVALSFDTCNYSRDSGDMWVDPSDNLKVDLLVKCYARFDGIRHLWFGNNEEDDIKGYLNYCSASTIIDIFQVLREKVLELCNDPESEE